METEPTPKTEKPKKRKAVKKPSGKVNPAKKPKAKKATKVAKAKAPKPPKAPKAPKVPKAPKAPRAPKVPILPLPTAEDIKGKSLEELDVIWANILHSEAALDRKAPDFKSAFDEHCKFLRLINVERRLIRGEPEP